MPARGLARRSPAPRTWRDCPPAWAQAVSKSHRRKRMKPSYLFVKCLVAFGMAASVHAQGFYWNTASARSMALGGVYLPSQGGVIDSLSANPAGLAFVGGRTLDLNLTGVFAHGSFSNSVNTNAPLKDAPGVIPYGAFGMPIGHSRFSIGFGVTPELTSVSNWNYVDA